MEGLSIWMFLCSLYLKRKRRHSKVHPRIAQDPFSKRKRDQIFYMPFGISHIMLCNMTDLSQHNALGRNDKRHFSQLCLKKPRFQTGNLIHFLVKEISPNTYWKCTLFLSVSLEIQTFFKHTCIINMNMIWHNFFTQEKWLNVGTYIYKLI